MAGSSGAQRQAPQAGGFNPYNAASQTLQEAMGGARTAMQYTPQQVEAAKYDAERIKAGQLAGADLGAYTNPYESQVVQNTMSDLDRARMMTQNQNRAQAVSAGAFGGSRQGIAEAETNRAFAQQAANAAAQLRQSGFNQAQQMAQQDIASRMQADLANQAAVNAARQSFANQSLQAGLANQSTDLAGAQFRLGAAQQLANLGQQGFNYGQQISAQQLAQGGMAQALNQQLLDKAAQQYQGYTGAPQQSLNTMLNAVGAGNMGQQTQTTTKSPGLLDWASVAATAYASDPRLKDDVKKVGEIKGINFYTWKWNDEGKKVALPNQPEFGVMADELQKTHPHLVKRGDDGYLRVHYSGLRAELEAA